MDDLSKFPDLSRFEIIVIEGTSYLVVVETNPGETPKVVGYSLEEIEELPPINNYIKPGEEVVLLQIRSQKEFDGGNYLLKEKDGKCVFEIKEPVE